MAGVGVVVEEAAERHTNSTALHSVGHGLIADSKGGTGRMSMSGVAEGGNVAPPARSLVSTPMQYSQVVAGRRGGQAGAPKNMSAPPLHIPDATWCSLGGWGQAIPPSQEESY